MKFNKGEWSELYVFIKILSDNKIFLLDENLNYINSFYEVIKVIRKELINSTCIINKDGKIIKQYENSNIEIEKNKIIHFSLMILDYLKNNSGSSFTINEISDIFQIIDSSTIKSGNSYNKSDITLFLSNSEFFNKEFNFNIKSYIGNSPTLLNSSRATNFIYSINISEKKCKKLIQLRQNKKLETEFYI
jgi:type II restriction enzyme